MLFLRLRAASKKEEECFFKNRAIAFPFDSDLYKDFNTTKAQMATESEQNGTDMLTEVWIRCHIRGQWNVNAEANASKHYDEFTSVLH